MINNENFGNSFNSLTSKEREITNYIMDGIPSSDISKAMNISMNTVNFHMKNIFSKLGAKNRTHASSLIYKQKLLRSETLCREMNHRIKNSLSILCSLITMKSDLTDNKNAMDTLKWINEQIYSFAKFHELLLEYSGSTYVPVKKFFETSIEHMVRSYLYSNRNISVERYIDNCLLHMNIAVPCMQIINEWVTNAIKYAFHKQTDGKILIRLRETSRNKFELEVEDNGIGIDCIRAKDDLIYSGTKITKALINQINGKHTVQSNGGTKHRVIFNQPERITTKISSR